MLKSLTNEQWRQAGGDSGGMVMVRVMRLVLALTAVLTLFIAPADLGGHMTSRSTPSDFVFGGYLLYSATLLAGVARRRKLLWHGKAVYWIDLAWYALMVYCSGGGKSFFFPFFFFVILTSSFEWGFDDGARITLGAALAVPLASLLSDSQINHVQLLLRTAFLLALGYMIAYWGGMGVSQRRRLRLLRDVSRLANPRFGVDQTIASMLRQTRDFYAASNCVLLMRGGTDQPWQLHSAGAPGGRPSLSPLPQGAAEPLLVFQPGALVQYAAPLHRRLPATLESRFRPADGTRWLALSPDDSEQLIDLLDASSFISAPLPLRKGEGRIYVVSDRLRFSRADAIFLQQLAAQVFPVIENILLLDRLASDAAFRERQKIARDLHDTAIQPYIGLRHGISAVRQSLQADAPAAAELDKLLAMTTEVIADMRQFARNVRQGAGQTGAELLVALRRQAQQLQSFYDIQITIHAEDELSISDRLAPEVFQIVNEGMHNIRKHTRARSGTVNLSHAGGQLRIRMENETPDGPAAPFLPGSIAERAAALGGTIEIVRTPQGATAVCVAIPV